MKISKLKSKDNNFFQDTYLELLISNIYLLVGWFVEVHDRNHSHLHLILLIEFS